MNVNQKMDILLQVKESIQNVCKEFNLPNYFHVAEVRILENCVYFEIEMKAFIFNVYAYIHDFSDSLEVHIYPNGAVMFYVKYNLE